ncbi:MAG: hypothetical protein IT463_01720 [Planctomycetes bacterium]|nr:hypothetical protein [Planctomycetota bacterium]
MSKLSLREARRGGVLPAAMVFLIVVLVAGTALLSVSTIHRLDIVRNGVDVRLMIACEAGVESVRGRFTLVDNIQEDWSWISDTTWTSVGNVTVNGMLVEITALRTSDPSVPRARVRGRASASGRTRVVEQTIKVAAFSDYSVFCGEAGASSWGYFKCVGNFYSRGSCNFGAAGTEFFGNAWTSGSFTSIGDDIFHKGYIMNHPVITMPDDIANYTAIENGAKPPYLADNHVYYENTLEIQLMGTQYRRIFVKRANTATANPTPPSWSAGTTAPTGYPGGASLGLVNSSWAGSAAGWCDVGGLTNSSSTFARGKLNIHGAPRHWDDATVVGSPHSSVQDASSHYVLAWETKTIPNNGVIYVKLGSPAAYSDYRDSDKAGEYNRYTQRTIDFGDLLKNVPNRKDERQGAGGVNPPLRTPVLLLSGRLTDKRLTICGDGVNMVIRDNITYNSYASNPNLRREAEKTSAAALAVPEMLGVLSRERWSNQATKSGTYLGGGDVNMAYRYWRLLPASEMVTNIAGDGGHNTTAQNAMDGVFLGTFSAGDNYWHGTAPSQELWCAGGLISLYTTYYCENCWNYVHYDWDWRLQSTTPPFFLSSYNVSATFVPGTWRTWEE